MSFAASLLFISNSGDHGPLNLKTGVKIQEENEVYLSSDFGALKVHCD